MNVAVLRLLALTAVVASGCATTGARFATGELHQGMTKPEAIELLGRPDEYRQGTYVEALIYKNRLIYGWGWDRADHAVMLFDGIVVEYGAGEVRHGKDDLVFVPRVKAMPLVCPDNNQPR